MAGNTHTRSRAKKLHFTRIQPGVGFCRKKGSLGSAGEPVAAALLPTALLTVKNYYRADSYKVQYGTRSVSVNRHEDRILSITVKF